jgi:hypothetical protein
VKPNDTSLHQASDSGWQLLGELELSARASIDDAIRAWLVELLAPFNLSADFLNRVLKSAQVSAERAMHPDAVSTFGHIHLSVFAPREHASKGKTWGYFHIEKIENREKDVLSHDHAIDFYLYTEGE